MFTKTRTNANVTGTPAGQRRAFRPSGDSLERRDLLAVIPMFGNSTRTFAAVTGQGAAVPGFVGGMFGSAQFNGGTGSLLSNPNLGTVNGQVLNTGSLLGATGTSLVFPRNLGQFQNATFTDVARSPVLTSGFGVSSGLAFNNGLGGNPFGLGSNVGFNGNLFGSGLGASTGLAFNNGLGGTGTGSFLSSSGLAFNNGLGGVGLGNGNSLGATTGLAFNNGLGGTGLASLNGFGASTGLTFNNGLGNPFNNPFNVGNTSIRGLGTFIGPGLSTSSLGLGGTGGSTLVINGGSGFGGTGSTSLGIGRIF